MKDLPADIQEMVPAVFFFQIFNSLTVNHTGIFKCLKILMAHLKVIITSFGRSIEIAYDACCRIRTHGDKNAENDRQCTFSENKRQHRESDSHN